MFFLFQEQLCLNNQDFLENRYDRQLAFGPYARSGFDITVDWNAANRNVVGCKLLADGLVRHIYLGMDAYSARNNATLLEMSLFFRQRELLGPSRISVRYVHSTFPSYVYVLEASGAVPTCGSAPHWITRLCRW